ncbi:MAG: T9SS type A sorting domain-containing protein [Flavobacteriales bacterium]
MPGDRIEVYDITGKLLVRDQAGADRLSVPLPLLSAGLLLVRLQRQGRLYSTRIAATP